MFANCIPRSYNLFVSIWPYQGFGLQGKWAFISGEQRPSFRGTGEQRQYWRTGNIRKQIFNLWRTVEQANLFQRNKGTGTPLGGPHRSSQMDFLLILNWIFPQF